MIGTNNLLKSIIIHSKGIKKLYPHYQVGHRNDLHSTFLCGILGNYSFRFCGNKSDNWLTLYVGITSSTFFNQRNGFTLFFLHVPKKE